MKLNTKVSKEFISITFIVLALLWLVVFWYLRNPILLSFSSVREPILASSSNLERHVRYLAGITPSRSYKNIQSMLKAEEYIQGQFKDLGYEVRLQDVDSYRQTYHNIIVRYGDKNAKDIIVIGAHYDVAGDDNAGADDNASGVAGLIEIARLLKEQKPKVDTAIELVAYTLEEPPFFGGHEMGSAYHADQLKADGMNVRFMVSLEMIGYYSDEFLSQQFPYPFFYGFYPWTGNFIAIVSSPEDRQLTRDFKKSMANGAKLPVYSINAPSLVAGVNFSDHRSYWAHGWPALMVTDTAFFRNVEYHKEGDTPDRLDYKRMADVVFGVYSALGG